MIPGRWMINTSSFHSVSYAQLAVYKGELYVSAMDGIWKVTPGKDSHPVLRKDHHIGNRIAFSKHWAGTYGSRLHPQHR